MAMKAGGRLSPLSEVTSCLEVSGTQLIVTHVWHVSMLAGGISPDGFDQSGRSHIWFS